MICSWCQVFYTEESIYHVCDDGTTFADRRSKTHEEFVRERQARAKQMSVKATSNDELKLTAEDMKWLRGIKIKP